MSVENENGVSVFDGTKDPYKTQLDSINRRLDRIEYYQHNKSGISYEMNEYRKATMPKQGDTTFLFPKDKA